MKRLSLALLLLVACRDSSTNTPAQSQTPTKVASTAPDQKPPAEVPAPAAQPENPAKLTINSKVMGEERVILVRTPKGYEQGSDRYPVLYLTDGGQHIGHTSATVEFLAGNGRMPEMIVVGIVNTDRNRDLTPTHASFSENGREFPVPTSGGADKFVQFIETEVIPLVESKYRVQPYRVLAGHSFGGLFAMHVFTTKTDLFNAYIAASPTLPWDHDLVVNAAEKLLKQRPELAKTLFVTIGNEPGLKGGFDRLQQLLKKSKVKGFEWGMEQFVDEDHGSVVMRTHYQGLRKVFAGWQLPREKDGSIAGGLAGAEKHYVALSQRMGYQVQVPEALINQIGYQLLLGPDKKVDEAIEVFKVNVERYPDSANVHDSLGEAYEAAGKLDLARAGYQKAIEIGGPKADPNLSAYKDHLTNLDKKAGKQASAGTN
jgi:predicted alpha/beta superfamily hydrolase